MFKHWEIDSCDERGIVFVYYYVSDKECYAVVKLRDDFDFTIRKTDDSIVGQCQTFDEAIVIAEQYIIEDRNAILKNQRDVILHDLKRMIKLSEDLKNIGDSNV